MRDLDGVSLYNNNWNPRNTPRELPLSVKLLNVHIIKIPELQVICINKKNTLKQISEDLTINLDAKVTFLIFDCLDSSI